MLADAEAVADFVDVLGADDTGGKAFERGGDFFEHGGAVFDCGAVVVVGERSGEEK